MKPNSIRNIRKSPAGRCCWTISDSPLIAVLTTTRAFRRHPFRRSIRPQPKNSDARAARPRRHQPRRHQFRVPARVRGYGTPPPRPGPYRPRTVTARVRVMLPDSVEKPAAKPPGRTASPVEPRSHRIAAERRPPVRRRRHLPTVAAERAARITTDSGPGI